MKSTLFFFPILIICVGCFFTSCQNNISSNKKNLKDSRTKNVPTPADETFDYQEDAITIIEDKTPPPPPPPVIEEVPEEVVEEVVVLMDQSIEEDVEIEAPRTSMPPPPPPVIQEVPEEEIVEESEPQVKEFYSRKMESKKTNANARAFSIKPQRPEPQHNTEEYNHIVENEFLSAFDKPLSTFSIDVDNASYSNVRRYLNNYQMPPKDAVRIEEFINYFNYDYPQPNGVDPFSINTEVSDCPWNKEHKLVHIGLQGYELPAAQMPPSNLVFLLDVSGSMNSANKLGLLKKAFKLLVNQMREEDRVSIVVYAGASGLVLPPTSGADKNKIIASLDKLRAGGSTAGAAGIQLAYQTAESTFIKGGNNRIILATDGDFNVGTSSTSELVRLIEEKRKSGVFLSILGFGRGNYKDARMEQLADNGNGNYAYIDNFQEAKKVFVQEMGGTLHTIAKDVKLQVEFNPAHIKEYRLVGYENRKLKNEDFNNDKKDAGDLGAGHTVTAIYEIILNNSSSSKAQRTDALKYQDRSIKLLSSVDPDLMTIKLRYKKPNEDVSKLIEVTVKDEGLTLSATSNNFRFSAAVAGFAMILRDSEFKGNANFENVKTLAQSAMGKDKFGYRKEFLELVQKAKETNIRLTAKK